ncbi:MAG: hypothetical protein H8E12_19020 [Rhodobacteraceae bacterium]|nr:hypothetical protein [Paracoccaceae bacterium]
MIISPENSSNANLPSGRNYTQNAVQFQICQEISGFGSNLGSSRGKQHWGTRCVKDDS